MLNAYDQLPVISVFGNGFQKAMPMAFLEIEMQLIDV